MMPVEASTRLIRCLQAPATEKLTRSRGAVCHRPVTMPSSYCEMFVRFLWGLVMHPSGKRMAFTQSRTNYELWVLENFLPALKAAKQ
jgi:hypothetical protein